MVVGTWNTHAGVALRNGGLSWLLTHAPRLRILALQEVQSADELRAALRTARAADRFRVLPGDGYDGHKTGLPYLLVDRRRFAVEGVAHPSITFGEKYERRLLTAQLTDRRSGCPVAVVDVHVQPMAAGLAGAPASVRERHERQVQAVATTCGAFVADDVVTLALGDWNEQLDNQVPDAHRSNTAVARMRRAGLRPAHATTRKGARAVRLDDVFTSTAGVTVAHRRVLSPLVSGNNHDAVVAQLRLAHC